MIRRIEIGLVKDLVVRQQQPALVVLRGDRHQIGDDEAAGVRVEARLEDVRVIDVAPSDAGHRGRRQTPKSALLVENRAEDGRAVEPRPAEPVDRCVAADQRGGAAVADSGAIRIGVISPALMPGAPSDGRPHGGRWP